MATTVAYKPAGPTYALSVANTQHAAVAVTSPANEAISYAEFVNSGATVVCVTLAPLPATGTAATPTLVFPVDGTPTIPFSFVLPVTSSGGSTKIVAIPYANNGFSVSAIGSAAGPSIIYITPVVPA